MWCLELVEADKFHVELRDEPTRGHFVTKRMAHKIICVGYYWMTLFKDSFAYARNFHIWKPCVGREKRVVTPL